MGLYMSEQFGNDDARVYALMSKCWFKALLVCCSIFTCCCCFCCCCFCCGACATSKEGQDFTHMDPEDLEAEIREQDAGKNVPIVVQPANSTSERAQSAEEWVSGEFQSLGCVSSSEDVLIIFKVADEYKCWMYLFFSENVVETENVFISEANLFKWIKQRFDCAIVSMGLSVNHFHIYFFFYFYFWILGSIWTAVTKLWNNSFLRAL